MHISILSTLALAGSTLAQSSTASAKAAASTGKKTGGTVHRVMVSNNNGALTFTPKVLTAQVGHMVDFMFHPKNHSVAQGAFASPCTPLAANGFFSGFQPTNNTATVANNGKVAITEMNVFRVMVKSADPMWFYCTQAMHCQNGMVGVINPTNSSGQTIEAFAAAAKKATKNVSPAKVAGGTLEKVFHAQNVAHGTGAAKGTGAVKATGAAKGTGAVKATAAVKATSAAVKTNGTAKATSQVAAKATSAVLGAAAATGAAKINTFQQAAVVSPASSMSTATSKASASTTVRASNSTGRNGSTIAQGAATGPRSLLDTASSLGLLGLLASGMVLFT